MSSADTLLEHKPAELKLRRWLIFFAAMYFLASVTYFVLCIPDNPIVRIADEAARMARMAANPVLNLDFSPLVAVALCTKTALLGALCLMAASNVRRARPPIIAICVAHLVTIMLTFVLGMLFILNLLNIRAVLQERSSLGLLIFSSLIDLVVLIMIIRLMIKAERARFDFLKYLSPLQYQTLYALAGVLIMDKQAGTGQKSVVGKREIIDAGEIASNVDTLLSTFKGRQASLLRKVIYFLEYIPVLKIKPNFAYMSTPDKWSFISYWINELVETSSCPDKRKTSSLAKDIWVRTRPVSFINRLLRAALLAARQLVYIGYYSDAEVQKSIGFEKFSKRTTLSEEELGRKKSTELEVIQPGSLNDNPDRQEIVIIGSGAGASIMAYELVAQGFNVLMLERGLHVRPGEIDEDEAGMTLKLYADGIMQYSRNMELQVVQGSCVGGSTVVNNGICFTPPAEIIKEKWGKYGANIDYKRFEQSVEHVRGFLKVAVQPNIYQTKPPDDVHTVIEVLNPSGQKFIKGLKTQGKQAEIIEANIEDCIGCGYCNIGCRYGRKLSMLDHVLPLAQQMHKVNCTAGTLRILPECEVVRLHTTEFEDGTMRATFAECRIGNDQVIKIPSRAFIVAAGAIASSRLLMQSNMGGPAVGTRLSFNVAGVMSGHFDDKINAYAGLQMSHYYRPNVKPGNLHRQHDAYVLETWFNPPMTQALAMPGWFENHFEHMQAYAKMMSIGVLVGTTNTSYVLPPSGQALSSQFMQWLASRGKTPSVETDKASEPLTLGDVLFNAAVSSPFVFKASDEDLQCIVEGMIEAGKIMFAANARYVLPSTVAYHKIDSAEDLQKLRDWIRCTSDLQLGSAHPQGGNPISQDPRLGVVDNQFKVHNTSNVFVCDASVFPLSVGLNPQLTVMALAHYASKPVGELLNKLPKTT